MFFCLLILFCAILPLTANAFSTLPSCSPVWSVCGRTCTPRHHRAWPVSWSLWWSGQRTSPILPTPATNSVRPFSVCASWRIRTPSTWRTPGQRRYVGTGWRSDVHPCIHTCRRIHRKHEATWGIILICDTISLIKKCKIGVSKKRWAVDCTLVCKRYKV